MRLAQDVILALVSFPHLGADQDPAPELELAEMCFDPGEILVAEFTPQHCEQPQKPIRFEFVGSSSLRLPAIS